MSQIPMYVSSAMTFAADGQSPEAAPAQTRPQTNWRCPSPRYLADGGHYPRWPIYWDFGTGQRNPNCDVFFYLVRECHRTECGHEVARPMWRTMG
jgi:hypothetical protein